MEQKPAICLNCSQVSTPASHCGKWKLEDGSPTMEGGALLTHFLNRGPEAGPRARPKAESHVGLQTCREMLARDLSADLQHRAHSHVYILMTCSLRAPLDSTLTGKKSSLRRQSLKVDSSGFHDQFSFQIPQNVLISFPLFLLQVQLITQM